MHYICGFKKLNNGIIFNMLYIQNAQVVK